ncbi:MULTISPECIES: hypothetical protein [Halomonadaceae]|uniref:hypothetical protein n=1 Tax=Halomonadaceae TaxID=28256 RepID=UPI001583F381|nr:MULTISPECIES: hypothetical protein [Halomonas]MDI4637946.1 hypothetical protein [Halomonas sp. BMC7]NUJ58949.1 hypothetical protein [Halomonas taeanensis]
MKPIADVGNRLHTKHIAYCLYAKHHHAYGGEEDPGRKDTAIATRLSDFAASASQGKVAACA